MKNSSNILTAAALLALLNCSPKKNDGIAIQPGAPLFPTTPVASSPGTPGQAGAVNPPHGQPGHNCAVPVGAPLNGAPAPALNTARAVTPGMGETATPVSPTTTPAGATVTTPAGPAAVPSAPVTLPLPKPVAAGTNPPHGQPGHDCSIAVGAPLKTAGAAAPAAITTLPAAPAPTRTAPGTNPPHGQPGHDCSIAVGAPLKTKK